MPIPVILGIAAALTGVTGVGTGIHGAIKVKEAGSIMKIAKARYKKNVERFEDVTKNTTTIMDELGELELRIVNSFEEFSDTYEKIAERPVFKEIDRDGIKLPEFSKTEMQQASIGARVLLGGLGGAAAGTAGGFAAAGATTSAVMAFGSASTGVAISSLSGVAATNATLAALGGGAIAAGGGGVALGTTMLGLSTLGVGLLVGGVVFSITGGTLSKKADQAWKEMKEHEALVDRTCIYSRDLMNTAKRYIQKLKEANDLYLKHLEKLKRIVASYQKPDWYTFSKDEQLIVENTLLLVGLLYNMCKVQLVLGFDKKYQVNVINDSAISQSLSNAHKVIESIENQAA